MSTSPVRPSGPKRVLDIERALSWAYREELPKRQRRLAFENAVDRPRMQPSPLARMMALATPIDSWSRHPGFPAALEDAHPDALAIESAVHRLWQADLIPDPAEYASELVRLVSDLDQYGRAAVGRLVELVMTSAKLADRPPIPDAPRPGPLTSPVNGQIAVRQLLGPSEGQRDGSGGPAKAIREVPAKAIRKNEYRKGAYCPLRWFPNPASIVRERAEYLAWWLALEWLAAELCEVDSLIITPPSAPRRPWAEPEPGPGEGRILSDLRDAATAGRRA